MKYNRAVEMSALVKGIGVAIGQCLFGVYGPFLFNRFGLHDAAAAATGVLVGAAVGYGVAAAAWHVRHREPAPGHTWRRIGVHAQLGANLRM
jgi:hypothetical protein